MSTEAYVFCDPRHGPVFTAGCGIGLLGGVLGAAECPSVADYVAVKGTSCGATAAGRAVHVAFALKTLKYRRDFPERFGSIQDARAFCQGFFAWYNTEHRHGGRGLLTPHDVHYGMADQRRVARATVLAAAYAAHPERFPNGVPQPAACPSEVWINPPRTRATEESAQTLNP